VADFTTLGFVVASLSLGITMILWSIDRIWGNKNTAFRNVVSVIYAGVGLLWAGIALYVALKFIGWL
jgi:hypothetical protein